MAANSGTSTKTPNGESKRPTYERSLTLKRKDAEREQINDLAKEVCQWLSQILDVEITPENYLDKLDTGVELCKLQNILVAGGQEAPISYNANAKKHSMHAQENITRFIKWCKGFIHGDEVLESNDLVDHKSELKCQARVLSCLDKVRKRYTSVHVHVHDTEVNDNEPKSPSDITDHNDPSDLPRESEGNNEEKKQEVASCIQEPASNDDGDESNSSSNQPISNKGPQEEESEEEKERNSRDNPAPEPTAGDASENNSDVRFRHIASNKQSQEETSQKEDKEVAGDHNASCRSYFYPLVFLCLILLAFMGALYFFK